METHPTIAETLDRLEQVAPGAKLLALGQTVFWDEPLKAGLPILGELVGKKVSLIAGVHDTDYFAKLPGGYENGAPYLALPKNDGSTKGFWSAAGEFSALFGSETPVTREKLAEAGVFLDRIGHGDQQLVDDATEAWGWRGIATSDPIPKVTKEVPIGSVFTCLNDTFRWALDLALERLHDPEQRQQAIEAADNLQAMVCDAREECPGQTLAEFYECLLPSLHEFVTGIPSPAEITRTSRLLAFDRSTAHLPRFRFVDIFLRPETAEIARAAYDAAVEGSEVYPLERFGVGAIPFDLVILGEGRGTIRLTKQMLVVMTHEPKFVPLEKPVESIEDLAAITQEAFGTCALVGKAITLISMLAAEFVFAFHEGASLYVRHTREMNSRLREAGIDFKPNPILRIEHGTWDALADTQIWFRLPDRLRAPFGAEHVSGHTFAKSWRCVGDLQRNEIKRLGEARNLGALIKALNEVKGGRWETLAREYESLREALRPLKDETRRIKAEVKRIHERLRKIKREWAEVERKRGEHFRAKILNVMAPAGGPSVGPSAEDVAYREGLGEGINGFRIERRELRERLRELRRSQAEAANTLEVRVARERRKEIEREAELARLRCVQEAVLATDGLEKTNHRPGAWWLPIVSPDGSWFRSVLSQAKMRLEPLTD